MATYTSNYQLHQWVPSDNFLRTDFNADFLKIDAALASKASASGLTSLRGTVNGIQSDLLDKAELVTGSYTGNGSTQTISLGFRPRAVIIALNEYSAAAVFPNLTSPIAAVSASGFSVTNAAGYSYNTNKNNTAYAYLALK